MWLWWGEEDGMVDEVEGGGARLGLAFSIRR